jgi:predicted nucleic acid-binding protein
LIVLDAHPLIALIRGEPAADEVESLLNREESVVPSINLAEALDQLLRIDLHDHALLEGMVATLTTDRLSVLGLDERLAWATAELRAQHYHRSIRALSVADCVLLASARQLDASIVTSDPAVAETARLEAIDLIALPDSQGRRP